MRIRAFGGRLGGVVKRPRVYAALALPLALPLFLAAVRVQPEFGSPSPASIATPELRYDDLRDRVGERLPEHSVILTIEKGDTLDKLLMAGGLTAGESAALAREAASEIDVRRLRPGNMVRFHYDQERVVDAVQIRLAGWGEIGAIREGGGFKVHVQPAVIREVETTINATINHSLYGALRVSGEGPQVTQQLVDIFQWDIDFFGLQKDDSFTAIVTKRYAGNDLVGYGPVVAARFTHKGKTFEAYRHEMLDGTAGYYTADGTPLRKQFLKAPLKFSRITSGFSKSRFHPVLKHFRPHYGVDYGAPIGTPVMTTADGVVVEARFKAGEGNFVRIRHSSRTETYYLHLSRFGKDIKKGAKVTQGDVIGYVGMTGLATGPHLDYRVTESGKWIDPLQLKSVTPDPIGGESLRRFRVSVARLAPQLAAPAQDVAENRVHQRALF
jgi:murein DD-endopeptidase MepM/ murein hydrolase activator NlpD